ncbi:hypothetical protein K2Y11_07695 [bacterium]|nr:hypothetical protein [bacterium]
MTINATDLRLLFRRFAGTERYVRFVRAINRLNDKNRLRFWQQDLWNDFVVANSISPRTTDEIVSLLSVCYVHEIPLLHTTTISTTPAIRSTPEYESAEFNLFPYAINDGLLCLECRDSRKRWIEDNDELCRILRCKTTYEEYCVRQLAESACTPDFRAKIKTRSAEIAALMLPGDELWEWDAGGWHRLAGNGGVAIVRDGQIIKQWCEFKS